jgi:hypothetical protein
LTKPEVRCNLFATSCAAPTSAGGGCSPPKLELDVKVLTVKTTQLEPAGFVPESAAPVVWHKV